MIRYAEAAGGFTNFFEDGQFRRRDPGVRVKQHIVAQRHRAQFNLIHRFIKNPLCCAGGSASNSEKFSFARPFFTSRVTSQYAGTMQSNHASLVSLEWQS
jgi:hypothetical protein